MPENEFLIRHPKPSQDFASIGYDSRLQSEVYRPKRTFSPNLLATFPAVGGDETGMWMPNYASPYSTPEIKEQFTALGRLLAEVIQTKSKKEFSIKVISFLEAQRKLEAILKSDDYKY